jgi:hypothetical protein
MKPRRLTLAVALAATAVLLVAAGASANVPLTRILTDPFTNGDSQHKTVVEPDTYSAGSTIVAVAQMGQFTTEGASGIGFAASTNNGGTWTSGVLPGITRYQNPAGPYDRATDASIAFDSRHNVWIASSLGLSATSPSPRGVAVLASRSTNGGLTWANPVTIAAAGTGQDFEKPWIVCDGTATSPFWGSCYAVFDDHGHSNALKIAYSRDGGLTWTAARVPTLSVIGGQPVTLPNGNVVVPIDNATQTKLEAVVSGNGGVSFGQVIVITTITAFQDPGNIRSSPLPSAEIDGAGNVYVAWQDCRFRTGCTANDIVYVTSADGVGWSLVKRVPIDGVTSGVDHFVPGIGVDKGTSGPSAHVAVTYYYYPNASCTIATCQLDVGFISTTNGGSTWSAAVQLAGPMMNVWLPQTTKGRMFGDYISTSYGSDGLAHPVIVVANQPTGGTSTDCAQATPNCDVALYAGGGLG